MSNNPMHWAVKATWRDVWAEEVGYAFLENKLKFGKLPLKNPKIKFVLYMVQPFDKDGAYNSVKPLIDSLKVWKNSKKTQPGLGIIIDDSEKDFKLSVKTMKVKHREEEHVEIIIKI
jgi:hypothetical protein